MFAKIDIKYEIDKSGKYIFKDFSDYLKYLYSPFYYAYFDHAYVRERCIIYDDNDIENIKERYIDNTLYVDSYRPSCRIPELRSVHHVWFVSDRVRANMYMRQKSRTDFHNHTVTYYNMQTMLADIYGKEVICPTV